MRSRCSSAAARTGALAVAPEIHRSMRHYRHAWQEFSSINGAAFESCFDKETADRLIRYPLINAGVFALPVDAPHWQGWADLLGEALQRSTDMTDQIALNVLVYDKGFACEPLPSRCNWPVHHATPAWDADRGLFVEPAMPYEALGILHLTIYTKRLATLDVREIERAPCRAGAAALVALARSNAPYSAAWSNRRIAPHEHAVLEDARAGQRFRGARRPRRRRSTCRWSAAAPSPTGAWAWAATS